MIPLKLDIRLNGKDQTSGSATAKQKEEGSFKDKRRDCYILFLDSCLAWVFPVCFVQTLVQQVSERLSVLALKADSLFEEWYTMYFCLLDRIRIKMCY